MNKQPAPARRGRPRKERNPTAGVIDPVAYIGRDADTVNPGEILKLRQSLKLTREDFAVLFAVTGRCVDHWEGGKRELSGPARVLFHKYDRFFNGGVM